VPFPSHLLQLLPSLVICRVQGGEPLGTAGEAWPESWGTEAWVLPLEPLLRSDAEGCASTDSMQRLSQAGLAWEGVEVQVGERCVPGCLVPDMGRARAVRFGYRLDRWAVFRVTPDGVQAVYTGRKSRMPRDS